MRENLIVDLSYQFALDVISLAETLRKKKGFELASQLSRAGASIGANIEEGQAAQIRADFKSKMSIAAQEARETRYWLRLARDGDILSELPKNLSSLKSKKRNTRPTSKAPARNSSKASPTTVSWFRSPCSNPRAKPSRQTDLERLFGLFDQSQSNPDNALVLSIADEDYPERFPPVIRRLMKAISEPALRDTMQIEGSPLPVDSEFPICQHPAMENPTASFELRPAIPRA